MRPTSTRYVYDPRPPMDVSNWETGYYAQDDFRVNSRLTLNLGFRYDRYTPYVDKNDIMANFDPDLQECYDRSDRPSISFRRPRRCLTSYPANRAFLRMELAMSLRRSPVLESAAAWSGPTGLILARVSDGHIASVTNRSFAADSAFSIRPRRRIKFAILSLPTHSTPQYTFQGVSTQLRTVPTTHRPGQAPPPIHRAPFPSPAAL